MSTPFETLFNELETSNPDLSIDEILDQFQDQLFAAAEQQD